MRLEQAKEMVGRALGFPDASTAFLRDHLNLLGLRLSRFRRSQRESSAIVAVKRDDGREFSRESSSDEEAFYLAIADALLAKPGEEVIRTEGILATGEDVILVVSRVSGVCPAQYATGQRWALNLSGGMRPRLCKPAIAAIEQATHAAPAQWSERAATCVCPAKLGEVEFTLQTLPAQGSV